MSWKAVTLGDITSNIQTGPFGSQLHQSDYSEEGTPVVMPKDLVNGHIFEASIARVSEDHVNRLSRHKIEVGDILYSRRGDVGRCAFATDVEQGWLCGTGCLRVTIDRSKAVPKFVFYQLQKAETVGWVEKHAVGATMLNLNTSILSSIPIEMPSIEEQKIIVDMLSAYDDLIENNQKQIKLLEEAAQRLYKEWFVDLRFPGYETTPITEGIPEGWEERNIDDVFSVQYGKMLPTSLLVPNGEYPVYGANGVIGHYTKANCFDYVTLITSRGNGSGDVLRTHHKTSFVTNNSFVVLPKETYVHLELPFAYHLMKTLDFKSICTGSAQPQLTNKSISMLNVIVPTPAVVKAFCNMANPMFAKIELLYKQIQVAAEARDRLLPKLMNGEIEV